MLVGITLNHPEYAYAYPIVTRYAANRDPSIRGTALLCFGHLARIFNFIDAHPMIEYVCEGLRDPDEWVKGQAFNAFDDICMFAPIDVVEELRKTADMEA